MRSRDCLVELGHFLFHLIGDSDSEVSAHYQLQAVDFFFFYII